MRLKSMPTLWYEWDDTGLPKIVRKRRQVFKHISEILDANPVFLDLVHEELARVASPNRKGRRADYTSENILRTLVVMAVEGTSLRETVVTIGESPFLQGFVRLQKRATMDYTFLDKCFCAISPETWKRVQEALGGWAVAKGRIDPSVVRVDTTVTETNIHYPTDTSLLWDSWRVLRRLLTRARDGVAGAVPHRFHDRPVKRKHLYICRYAASSVKKRQRKVKRSYRGLIADVRRIVGIAERFCAVHGQGFDFFLCGIAQEIDGYLPAIRTVLEVAERAHLKGERVPARERVFSIFEPHTELIMRGRRSRPVEFGHLLALSQTREKFITDYEAYAERPPDCKLTKPLVERHEALFGSPPDVMAGDKGFSPSAEVREELEQTVCTLAIPRRMSDLADALLARWQKFRAGIEGTISALKRVYRLFRCHFRGFKGFRSAVGLGVFGHNLVVLARQNA